jgi:hypothetical protein
MNAAKARLMACWLAVCFGFRSVGLLVLCSVSLFLFLAFGFFCSQVEMALAFFMKGELDGNGKWMASAVLMVEKEDGKRVWMCCRIVASSNFWVLGAFFVSFG